MFLLKWKVTKKIITYFIDEIKHKPPVLSKVTDIKIIDKEIEGYTNLK